MDFTQDVSISGPNAGENDFDSADALTKSMEKECDFLDSYRFFESELKASIHRKDWPGIEKCIAELTALAGDLSESEASRHRHFEDLRIQCGEPEDATFYQVIVHTERSQREILSALYRRMKLAVLQIQAITWCINEHVQSINDALQEVLEELFPHRKGSIYSKEGTRTEVDAQPMLFSRSL